MVPPTPTQPAPPEPTIIYQKPEIGDVMLAAFAAMGFALSARFLLFLSLLGAFILCLIAMIHETNFAAVICGLFSAFTVLPLVGLEISHIRSKG